MLIFNRSSCSRSALYYSELEHRQNLSQPAEGVDLPSSQPKKKCEIASFWNDTSFFGSNLEKYAASELKAQLAQNDEVFFDSNSSFKLATYDFLQGNQVRLEALFKAARALGSQIVVLGKILKAYPQSSGDELGLFREKETSCEVSLEVKAYDVNSEREIFSDLKSAISTRQSHHLSSDPTQEQQLSQKVYPELAREATRKALIQITPGLHLSFAQTQWRGRIVNIEGENPGQQIGSQIVINGGRAAGLRLGDVLKVFGSEQEIFDPVSGAYLGKIPGKSKGTLSVSAWLEGEGCVTKLHSGGPFEVGDAVQMYTPD